MDLKDSTWITVLKRLGGKYQHCKRELGKNVSLNDNYYLEEMGKDTSYKNFLSRSLGNWISQ
uniref:Uncharacterized protein n=1 Tax=Salix viminalis TaxID=40686 RepID=A0A6N2N6A2_SALVM